MLLQHQPVIHFVDVIARQNQHVLRLFRADRIDVLINRVRRSHVPVIADSLHGRQNLDELSHLPRQDVPALADVAVQRQRFVLGEDVNPAKIRVDAVRKGDVDDAVNAAEGHGGLGAVASERVQALPSPAC